MTANASQELRILPRLAHFVWRRHMQHTRPMGATADGTTLAQMTIAETKTKAFVANW